MSTSTCPTDLTNMTKQYNDVKGTLTQVTTAQASAVAAIAATPISADMQRQLELAALLQSYNNAKETVAIAPSNLKIARKNYVVFDKGQPEYDGEIKAELTAKATTIANAYTDQFNDNIEQMNSLINIQDTLTDSLNSIDKYNTNLQDSTTYGNAEIADTKTDVNINDRKSFYENQNFDTLKDWHMFIAWVYWLLAIIFILCLLLSNKTLSLMVKGIIIASIFLYYFAMKYILIYLLQLLGYLYTLLPKNVYTSL